MAVGLLRNNKLYDLKVLAVD